MAQITNETYLNGVLVSTDLVVVPDAVVNRDQLNVRAHQALAVNATFLGLAPPTNAQVVAQVQRLTRQVNALIRLQLDELDDTAGT